MAGPNPYFDNYNNADEQSLHDGLVQESIEIYGEAMWYLPRRAFDIDLIYTEDPQNFFDTVYLSTFYIKNVDGFEGNGSFMSKFGLEIRDQITLTVSDTIFMQDIGNAEGFARPREGDLIWFPLNKKLFEVTFVDKFQMFYPLGAIHSYDITCQLYEWNGSTFNTGIPEIDLVQQTLSQNIFDWSMLTEDGSPFMTEDGNYLVLETFGPKNMDVFDQTDDIQQIGDDILNFDENDPFSEGKF
jgi:hypothetical protein